LYFEESGREKYLQDIKYKNITPTTPYVFIFKIKLDIFLVKKSSIQEKKSWLFLFIMEVASRETTFTKIT